MRTGFWLFFEHGASDAVNSRSHLINIIAQITLISLRRSRHVHCIEECAEQIETLLRQAFQESMEPNLFLKEDIIATYNDNIMGDMQAASEKDTMTCDLHGWVAKRSEFFT